jgi:hypothetical protein
MQFLNYVQHSSSLPPYLYFNGYKDYLPTPHSLTITLFGKLIDLAAHSYRQLFMTFIRLTYSFHYH